MRRSRTERCEARPSVIWTSSGERMSWKAGSCDQSINRPFLIGIAVYHLAKQRMLMFYYDFLDRYYDRRDFELMYMDG